MQKELVIGLDMQQVHHLGHDCIENGHMFLHHGADILITSIDSTIKEPQLCTVSNFKGPAHSIVMILMLPCTLHPVCHMVNVKCLVWLYIGVTTG